MLEGLSWIDDTYPWGYCVTFARGLDEAEMLGRFVGDPSRAWLIPDLVEDEVLREELEELEEDGPIVQVGSCEGWAFALEVSGSHVGTLPQVLQRVSSATVALSLYFNALKGFFWFYYAENGVLAAHGELGIEPYAGDDPSRVLPFIQQAARMRAQSGGLEAVSTLAEAIGVRLDREAVAQRPLFRTWITPPDEAYKLE